MKEKALPKNKPAKTEKASSLSQSSEAVTRPVWMEYLMNFWIFIPVAMYFSVLSDYALNIPYIDDYDAILGFLNNFSDASFGEKVSLLFSWHNEHKIVPSRIIFALYYQVTGSMNFSELKYVGSFQLVIAFAILATFIRPMFGKLWGIPAIIAGFCIFDFSSYYNAMCTMGGVANYGVIMFFMAALYFYNSSKKNAVYYAGAMHALCILSNGNGIIGAVCLILFALLLKDKKKIITAIAVTIVFALMFFLIDVPGFSDPRNTYANTTFNLGNSIMYFLNLNGAHFSFLNAEAIETAYIYGVVILGILVFAFPLEKKWKIAGNALPIVTLTLFVLGSFATLALFRAIEGNHFYTSRYMVYPHLITAMAVILLLYKFRDRTSYKWAIAGVAGLFLLFTYSKNKEYGERCFKMEERRLISRPFYYDLFGDPQKDFEHAKAITEEACIKGIYCLEDAR